MSDLADVENALKALIVGWIYPNGTSEPSAVPGAVAVKVGRAWPERDPLMADLVDNIANISIYSQPGSERLTTRYPRAWQTMALPANTITASISGAVITFGGVVATPQNVAILFAGNAYGHAVQASDTLATIAAALAAAIPGATSAGAVLTLPSAIRIAVRIGGIGQIARELRRQERLFQVTIWTNTPEQRDAVAGLIDAKFAGAGDVNGLEFITLPDGFRARIQYVRTAPTDKDELSGSFRRDLIYSVEYATTETQNAQQIVAFETKLTDPGGDTLSDTYA